VLHKTTPDVQDQDQDQDRICWSQTGLVLRPTVSDHMWKEAGRGSWGCWGLDLSPRKYAIEVRVCFDPPKMSHSFIQNCCWITLQVSHHKE